MKPQKRERRQVDLAPFWMMRYHHDGPFPRVVCSLEERNCLVSLLSVAHLASRPRVCCLLRHPHNPTPADWTRQGIPSLLRHLPRFDRRMWVKMVWNWNEGMIEKGRPPEEQLGRSPRGIELVRCNTVEVDPHYTKGFKSRSAILRSYHSASRILLPTQRFQSVTFKNSLSRPFNSCALIPPTLA